MMKNRIGHDMMTALDGIACLSASGRRALDDEKSGLLIAARCLDRLARGERTERMECLAAAVTVGAYIMQRPTFSDLTIIKAGEVLHALAMGTVPELNDDGRRRAGHLAECVRILTEGVPA